VAVTTKLTPKPMTEVGSREASRLHAVTTEVMELKTSAIDRRRTLRATGLDPAHVETLAELADAWPPIVVRRADHTVIDGQHRLAAAVQLGLRRVRAVYFDGTADDAYVEFVRCNVGHGLPLGIDERRAAVRRILGTHPERSDRGIAELCGVSPKTVARMRDELGVREGRATSRVGRDGRSRPVDAGAIRERIAVELERHPDASLRAIARTVGASPETVRSVRNRQRCGAPGCRPLESVPDADAIVLGLVSRRQSAARSWQDDRALATCDGGEQFVTWFAATGVDDADRWDYLGVVPLSRTYEVADEARRRAAFWASFAESLEGQVRRRA
jgi:ParB-like chromosome segregation protein Spo0J